MIRALVAALALAASPWLGTLTVVKNYKGSGACIDFGENVSTATMTLRVYSTPPVSGVGGTVLLTKTLAEPSTVPVGGTDPLTYYQCVTFTSGDTAIPVTGLYAELDVVWPDSSDTSQLLTFTIVGR